jgi:hypothetical protein
MECKRNEDILKELKTEPILGNILKYKTIWIQHVNRMHRLAKIVKNTTNHMG